MVPSALAERTAGHRGRRGRLDWRRPGPRHLANEVWTASRWTPAAIEHSTDLVIVTERDADGLDIIRHSSATCWRTRSDALFPDAQVTIGPTIENGFTTTSATSARSPRTITAAIEKKWPAGQGGCIRSRKALRAAAMKPLLTSSRLAQRSLQGRIIESIPAGEVLSLYRQGGFTDLSRPARASTSRSRCSS